MGFDHEKIHVYDNFVFTTSVYGMKKDDTSKIFHFTDPSGLQIYLDFSKDSGGYVIKDLDKKKYFGVWYSGPDGEEEFDKEIEFNKMKKKYENQEKKKVVQNSSSTHDIEKNEIEEEEKEKEPRWIIKLFDRIYKRCGDS